MIREAIGHAVDVGWRIVACASRTHCFARLLCPRGNRDGCHFLVSGVPWNSEDYARDLRRAVDRSTQER